jgi:PAS domain-containing protein
MIRDRSNGAWGLAPIKTPPGEQSMRLSTRLTVAMVALVLLATTAVGVLTYRNISAFVLPRAFDRLEAHADLLGSELAASVRGARADVIGFRSSNAVIDIMTAHLNRGTDPAAAAAEAEWRRRLGKRFEAELLAKPNYHQFRYIAVDDGGRELVRVDRSGPGGSPRTVPDSELERNDGRIPFTETIRLPPGGVYVSPVELNRNNGVIETPHVPVLRVATPIHAPDGRPFGIVIINVDMRPEFARIRESATRGARSYVVNDRGDYLVHPDPDREFGFEYNKPARIQQDFPEFARILATGDTAPRVVQDRAGERVGAGMDMLRLAEGPRVAVIEALPYSELMAAPAAVRDSSLIGGFLAAFCAVVMAIIVARTLTQPLVQMTKVVEGFSRDETVALPAGGGQEIGVLANAFARMAAESRAKAAALNREIEERRRTSEREQLLIAAVESSNDAILTETLDGVITGWNPAAERLFGFTAQEAIGNSIDIIVPDELRGEAQATLDKIKGGEKVDCQETVREIGRAHV